MKKFIFTIIFTAVIGSFANSANAQMMGNFFNSSADWKEISEHTLFEEKEGKELWGKLQAKEVVCEDLSNEQFGVLGEYFMGTMTGDSHAAMNAMMIQMHGEDGERQIHIVIGKRLSGCDISASVNGISGGFMPMMMQMMMGGWSFNNTQDRSFPFNSNSINNMMNFGFGLFGWFGWILMILWWILIIAGIIALIKWLTKQSRDSSGREKSAIDVLKERYAKGEMDKKEFEEKKKDLS